MHTPHVLKNLPQLPNSLLRKTIKVPLSHAFPPLHLSHKVAGGSLMALTLLGASQFFFSTSRSANLISASVTLGNSRLSFRGLATTGNVTGTTEVRINTTQSAAPSTSSAQLQEGDTLVVDNSATDRYIVTSVVPDGSIFVSNPLLAGHGDSGDHVYATQSGTLEVRFKPGNAIANGRIRLLVPAHNTTAEANDGLPDPGTFDFGTVAPTVTCPQSQTGYTFNNDTGTPTATASAVTIGGTVYHAFTCYYGGSGDLSADFGTANVVDNTMRVTGLINPAPASDHVVGTADRYRMIVQNLQADLVSGDQTTVSVGAIEAVRVSAEVAPQITFRILGLANSTNTCGVTTSVTTTPLQVPFGELVLNSFSTAAQRLVVSSNARSGYVVTAAANDQLSRPGVTCAGDSDPSNNPDCIQDSRGDDNEMSDTVADDWASTNTKGFGFTVGTPSGALAINKPSIMPFSYDVNINGCAGGGDDCYRQFADAESSQSPQAIFGGSTVADEHMADVCYKIVIGATQAAQLYENYITYRATASF